MKHTDTPQGGINRRGLFAGLVTGLGVAAIAAGARKVQAKVTQKVTGPVLYHRTLETERYFKSLY